MPLAILSADSARLAGLAVHHRSLTESVTLTMQPDNRIQRHHLDKLGPPFLLCCSLHLLHPSKELLATRNETSHLVLVRVSWPLAQDQQHMDKKYTHLYTNDD